MNRMTSPRNKSKVIKVLCLLSKKYEWLSFWAIKYSLHFPFKFPYHRFYKHTFKHLCISCGVFSKSLEMQRPLHPGRCYIVALSYLLLCSPSILIEHVKTLYDFCALAGWLWAFLFFCFFPTLLLLPYLKTKGKDAKDKEKLTRHQFVPGTFSGVLQCLVCDKTLLGKESFQCSSKFLGPTWAVFTLHLSRE